jgi:signal transduction histidine kinase
MSVDERGMAATPADEDLGEVLRAYVAVTGRLQQTHEALKGEVMRLRGELASKNRELELRRRLAALGELAAGVAHEVRNPLGAIRLYSDLLRDQCRALRLDPALALVEKIDAGIRAIDAVVEDTLALAPRDRGLDACSVPQLVERARDASQEVLSSRRVSLELTCGDPDVLVRGDPNGLQRVLVNLIVNAAEVSAPGQAVRVEIVADDARVRIHVRDQGPGLADDVRDRIFDPFFTTKQHGTGLGLTIAHRLVEAYGGRLTAENGPAGGAEFMVTLPRATASGDSDGSAPGAQGFSAA